MIPINFVNMRLGQVPLKPETVKDLERLPNGTYLVAPSYVEVHNSNPEDLDGDAEVIIPLRGVRIVVVENHKLIGGVVLGHSETISVPKGCSDDDVKRYFTDDMN